VRPAPVPSQTTTDLATLDAAMAQHIEAALVRTHGRIEGPDGAALLLGINPHTLRARMRKLKVDWKQFRRRSRFGDHPRVQKDLKDLKGP
jgi:hypothetical protein